MRRMVVLMLLALASSCYAQTKVKVNLSFSNSAERFAWIGPWPADGIPESKLVSSTNSMIGEQELKNSNDKLIILDTKAGNAAVLEPSSETKQVAVPDKAFDKIFRVGVRVEHAGRPVSVATVVVTSGSESRSQILTSSDAGTVWFVGLPAGVLKVKVKYRLGEQTKEAPVAMYEVLAKRDAVEPILVVALSDAVETIGTPKSKSAPAVTEQPSGGGVISRLVLYLLGIAVAIGVAYALLRTVQRNQSVIEDKLDKLGVKLPKEEVDDSQPVAAAFPQPLPVQQIILDDVPAPDRTPGESRLIWEGGGLQALALGESTLGRDLSCTIALPNEETLSRRHAKLLRSESGLSVEDLGSTNGTFVNGIRISSATPVEPGDQLQFGSVKARYGA